MRTSPALRCKTSGKGLWSTAPCAVDDLEDTDIGIQAIAAIPVGAAGDGIGESDVRVNFGGVTFSRVTTFMLTIPALSFLRMRWILSS